MQHDSYRVLIIGVGLTKGIGSKLLGVLLLRLGPRALGCSCRVFSINQPRCLYGPPQRGAYVRRKDLISTRIESR